jgi:hypothetical protein
MKILDSVNIIIIAFFAILLIFTFSSFNQVKKAHEVLEEKQNKIMKILNDRTPRLEAVEKKLGIK